MGVYYVCMYILAYVTPYTLNPTPYTLYTLNPYYASSRAIIAFTLSCTRHTVHTQYAYAATHSTHCTFTRSSTQKREQEQTRHSRCACRSGVPVTHPPPRHRVAGCAEERGLRVREEKEEEEEEEEEEESLLGGREEEEEEERRKKG